MPQATAKLNFLKMAPRKVRLIADTIRGLPVAEAEAQLTYRPRRAAKTLLKLLRSCVANAKNAKLDLARLTISKITVDQGPMMKRSLPRAQGRATPLQKKMSHVFLALEEGAKVYQMPFVISKPKKEKKATKPKQTKAPKSTSPAMEKSRLKKEEPGFFKRIFRRKSV